MLISSLISKRLPEPGVPVVQIGVATILWKGYVSHYTFPSLGLDSGERYSIPWANSYHLDTLYSLRISHATYEANEGMLRGTVDWRNVLLAVSSNGAYDQYYCVFALAQGGTNSQTRKFNGAVDVDINVGISIGVKRFWVVPEVGERLMLG